MADIIIGGHPAFTVKFAQRDMQRPLILAIWIGAEMAQTIVVQTETLTDAHACGPEQPQRIGAQVIGLLELLIQEAVVFRRQRLGQIEITRWKILSLDKSLGKRLAVADQVIEEAADAHQAGPAAAVGQGRSLLSQAAEPTQDVGIAAQSGRRAELGVGGAQIAQEPI